MNVAFTLFLFLVCLAALAVVVIMWHTLGKLQKLQRIERQVMLCFHIARMGDKELWERERDKALRMMKDIE